MTPLPKRLFVAAGDVSGSDDLYIFISTTNPIRWRQVYYYAGGAPGCATEDFSAKMFSFNNVAIMLTFNAALPNEQFISFDRGSSWARFVIGTIPFCYGGNDENNIYLCTANRLYISINKGSTWNLRGTFRTMPYTGVPIHVFRFDGATLPIFLVFDDEGLVYRSINNGVAWTIINTGLPAVVKVLRFGDTLIAFGNTQFCKSTDQGLTWSVPIDYFFGIVPGVEFFRDADQSDFEAATIVATVEGTTCISQDFASSWNAAAPVPGRILHSIVHAHDNTLLSVSRAGYYFVERGLAETVDEILFNVGNVNIKPGSIMKISPQTDEVFLSQITQFVLDKSLITNSINLKSSITLET